MDAVILTAGSGTRLWPYAEVRPKSMVPVAGKPLIDYNISALKKGGIDRILLGAGKLHEQISRYYRKDKNVRIIPVGQTRGSAETLRIVLQSCSSEPVLVLWGDTVIDENDLNSLIKAETGTVLLSPLGNENPGDWITCNIESGFVSGFLGHPRDEGTHRLAAVKIGSDFFPYLDINPGYFPDIQVVMMPPAEFFLEISLADYIRDGHKLKVLVTTGDFFDIDKPWQLMGINNVMVEKLCSKLSANELSENAGIDDSAYIGGFVKLGKNSHIGRNVTIKGSLIAGDNTVIENGAVIDGNAVIGNDTIIENFCFISDGSSIGDHCHINHCAELEGVIFNRVFLYHYMEFSGIIGEATDLGAATVCGTLRFDDGATTHRIKGRKELPHEHSNAVYFGDYVRTGVNAIIMPGCKVGIYSIVGPGVLLEKDLENNSLLMLKQETVKKHWGPERYGW